MEIGNIIGIMMFVCHTIPTDKTASNRVSAIISTKTSFHPIELEESPFPTTEDRRAVKCTVRHYQQQQQSQGFGTPCFSKFFVLTGFDFDVRAYLGTMVRYEQNKVARHSTE